MRNPVAAIVRPLLAAARAVRRDRSMLFAFGLLGLLILISIGAPLIVQHDPAILTPRLRLKPAFDDYWIGRSEKNTTELK